MKHHAVRAARHAATTRTASKRNTQFAAASAGHGVQAAAGSNGSTDSAPKASGPDYVGTWTGTFLLNTAPDADPQPVAVQFTRQSGVSVTGTFDLSAMAGAPSALTTVTITHTRQFLALIAIPNGSVSISAVVESNYDLIQGRWSVNGPKGWQTGVLTLKRDAAPAK